MSEANQAGSVLCNGTGEITGDIEGYKRMERHAVK
jgi:hypothetical protein